MSPFGIMWSPALFGLALFFSSALLFLVQPMLGRTLVPLLGGSAVAWNACLVFFQTTLLAGYVYADLVHRFRGLRWQPWLHLFLLALAVTLCFVGLFGDRLLGRLSPRLTSLESWPILTTLCLLVVVIALPFFAVAAITPLVQRWFAHLDHPKSSDPYFLLVASNLGGLMALVVYPLMIEPFTPLYAQWLSWKLAVTALGALVFMTALCAWQSPRSAELEPAQAPTDPDAPVVPKLIGRGLATWPRRLHWFGASAIPIALLMSASDYLTAETAPAPILWAIPLALYLIAFSQSYARFSPLQFGNVYVKISMHVVFGMVALCMAVVLIWVLLNPDPGRNREGPEAFFFLGCVAAFAVLMLTPFIWLWVLQPLSALAVVFVHAGLTGTDYLAPGTLILHLACFYLSVRLCLGALANDRPAAPALTAYYGWIGLGGLAGGLFQLLVAPLLFPRGFVDFAFLAALASTLRTSYTANGLTDALLCMLVLPKKDAGDSEVLVVRQRVGVGFDIVLAVFSACLTGMILLLWRAAAWDATRYDLAIVITLLLVTILVLRPVRFGIALTCLVALSFLGANVRPNEQTIMQTRSLKGPLRVVESKQEILFRGDQWGERPIPHHYTKHVLMAGHDELGVGIIEPPEMLRYPTGYYHRKGPIGQVMRRLEWFSVSARDLEHEQAVGWLRRNRDNTPDDARLAASLVGMLAAPDGMCSALVDPLVTVWSEPPIAVVGMNAGAILAYAHPYQWVDVYEHEPAVYTLSTQTPASFVYLQQALERGVSARVIASDPRRSLGKPGREGFYHALFVDFAGGPLPVHLLTRQAIETYFHKVAPDGIVCIRTNHRHFNLALVIEEEARALKLVSKVLHNTPGSDPTLEESEWTVVARTNTALQKWASQPGYERNNGPLLADIRRGPRPAVVWTDENANVLSAARTGLPWPTLVYGLLVLMLFFGVILGTIEILIAMVRLPVARLGQK